MHSTIMFMILLGIIYCNYISSQELKLKSESQCKYESLHPSVIRTKENSLAEIQEFFNSVDELERECSNIQDDIKKLQFHALGCISYNGHCYLFQRSRKTYMEAQQACRAYGGNLARVDGPKMNKWLVLQMKTRDIDELWIGATDLSKEGRFEWESTHLPITYSDWSYGQPDNFKGGEDCVHIRKSYGYKWNDAPCYSLQFFSVCEM